MSISKIRGSIFILFFCMTWIGNLTWQDGVKDTEDHGSQVKELQTDAVELWDAQPHKHVIGVKQTA